MRKFRKLFLVVIVAIFSSITAVNAASKCSYDEQAKLNNIVANIKASYEESLFHTGEYAIQQDGNNAEIVYDYFKISIYNLTEDVYVKITNDYNNEAKTITYANTESNVGVYGWTHLEKVTNFKITVYSSDRTSCPNEEYRIINLVTPRYNFYSSSAKCVNNEEFYLCQKYITEPEDIDVTTFETKLSSFLKNKGVNGDGNDIKDGTEKTFGERVIDFIEEYKVPIIIISTVIFVGGVVAIVIAIKKRRSRLI